MVTATSTLCPSPDGGWTAWTGDTGGAWYKAESGLETTLPRRREIKTLLKKCWTNVSRWLVCTGKGSCWREQASPDDLLRLRSDGAAQVHSDPPRPHPRPAPSVTQHARPFKAAAHRPNPALIFLPLFHLFLSILSVCLSFCEMLFLWVVPCALDAVLGWHYDRRQRVGRTAGIRVWGVGGRGWGNHHLLLAASYI